ncbi:hypothetical protein SLEP1_g37050 [Rubroshorea leprosula]|uniref:Uncharacterized protein n=1 Tax=Rubroshorea leprosula TaxID=152421 RepID=A0AAV5KTG7_9ROSI|nr:hypothetical protein SLEP1_g37050 [Rubroshorea leprosula]
MIQPPGENLYCPTFRLVTDIPATTGASFGQEVGRYESPVHLWTVGIHHFLFMLLRQLGRQILYECQYLKINGCRKDNEV